MKKSRFIISMIIGLVLFTVVLSAEESFSALHWSNQGDILDDSFNPYSSYEDAKRAVLGDSGTSTPAAPAQPAHTHNYTSTVTKEATCSEEGVMTYTCEGCGNSYTQPIPKTEHKWVETVITPATCSTEGEVKKVCSVCGAEVIEKIPVDSNVHDYEEVIVKEATCTIDGVAKKVCRGCGDETEEYAIPAIGHKYEEAVTKEPTCTEVGIKTFTCANCGDTYTEEIPALGHDEQSSYVYKAKIGSLVFEGKTVYTCSRCGAVREEADPNTYPLMYLISACILAVVIIVVIVILIATRKIRKADKAK